MTLEPWEVMQFAHAVRDVTLPPERVRAIYATAANDRARREIVERLAAIDRATPDINELCELTCMAKDAHLPDLQDAIYAIVMGKP